MELVEHRHGVQRLGNEHQECRTSENDTTCASRGGVSTKDRDDDRDDTLSDCESETNEVLSVGSEPMPDALLVDHEDDPRNSENYESDAETNIATRGVDSRIEREQTPGNGRSNRMGSSPFSRSPSPSLSSSASCNPPQSPASNYCTTPPQNQASPSSPEASSVRSPASSSATASSPGRPDAHQEAIVPRYQSASISSSIHHHGSLSQNHHNNNNNNNNRHHHLLSSNRYAAAALVTTCRDSSDAGEYSSIIGGTTVPRIPVHHPIGLTTVSHGVSAVADLIAYNQQSLDPGRSLNARAAPTLNVPLVTRLSLSPPTAMTVTGLQANVPRSAFHPVAIAAAAAAAAAGCRDLREANPLLAGHPAHLQHSGHAISSVQHSLLQQQASVSQIQHASASATSLHHHQHHQQQQQQHHIHGSNDSRHNAIGNQSSGQHRLPVSKLLQQNDQDSVNTRDTESPVSPEPRGGDDHQHRRQNHRHAEVSRNNSSPGSNGLQNSSGILATTNNHHHHHRNSNSNGNSNNNNMQHQASLKFSIDNILKADFGRRITDPISLKKSRTKKLVQRPIDLTKDFRESSSEGSERGSEASATNPSPGATSNVNTGCASASNNVSSGVTTTTGTTTTSGGTTEATKQMLWPAWVYCTRYSDRPSSGRSPRTRRVKRPSDSRGATTTPEEKRPRTAFSGEQLARLKREFAENRYLTERRRQQLSRDLGLNEAQIKIWFQNKRAKIKKASGQKNPLALQLMAQGLYNHSTVPLTKEEEEQAAELQAK